jgi:hypothetical protein
MSSQPRVCISDKDRMQMFNVSEFIGEVILKINIDIV